MDQMLPSPGFSIPSIGTPLHQPDEDQQILPNALQQQQESQQQQQYHMQPQMHSMNALQNNMMQTPQKSMHTYAMNQPFATPQSMMQPQTPVSLFIVIAYHKNIITILFCLDWKYSYFLAKHYVSTGSTIKPNCSIVHGTIYPRSYDTNDASLCGPWHTPTVAVSTSYFKIN